ncbi:Uncharacterised protein [Haploplasma axanthum]|uniref:Uncharacterized protein n=1 Tax=Haploplasma axanthum TaxID=29552 RepID=A0A449BBT6_HAPAX|nr:Uncharacterised protein [Haploplasma axanthum]
MLLLIDSKKVYGGDRLTVKSESFFDLKVKKYEDQNDLYKLIPEIIKNIGARRNFFIDDRTINDSKILFRKLFHTI